jgi:hypothetical protein
VCVFFFGGGGDWGEGACVASAFGEQAGDVPARVPACVCVRARGLWRSGRLIAFVLVACRDIVWCGAVRVRSEYAGEVSPVGC